LPSISDQRRKSIKSNSREGDVILLFNIAAWSVSGLLMAWMLFDLIRVNRQFDEDYLLSSHEGDIVDTEEAEKAEGLL
jgi:hypothetical protein